MEEKKTLSFAAVLITLAVAVAAVFGVKAVGGSVKPSDEQGAAYVAGTYTGEAKGMDVITVTATIDETGKVTALEVDASKETPGLGQVAAPKLVEKILEIGTAEGIDAISGCTITSNAVFAAVNSCIDQAKASEGGSAFSAGTYTAQATGMNPLTVTVTVDEAGKITAMEVDASNETPGLGQVAAPKLVEKILETGTAEGIDAISGCTVTSDAIFKAVADCLGQASR